MTLAMSGAVWAPFSSSSFLLGRQCGGRQRRLSLQARSSPPQGKLYTSPQNLPLVHLSAASPLLLPLVHLNQHAFKLQVGRQMMSDAVSTSDWLSKLSFIMLSFARSVLHLQYEQGHTRCIEQLMVQLDRFN
ncbi:hypothetical protein SORBI_3004G097500 [Sorghum bicolor]|uniref:Uncharacterized protein n=1 Tax=Sorghum bicolor TaxID=4558 RepID=A0A194YNN9_SORBI|nr:hypothetical protein SORBI_3004G097500 [Sorghum bicolor]